MQRLSSEPLLVEYGDESSDGRRGQTRVKDGFKLDVDDGGTETTLSREGGNGNDWNFSERGTGGGLEGFVAHFSGTRSELVLNDDDGGGCK